MVEYFCGRCGKSFYQKSQADRHRARKKPCTPVTTTAVVEPPKLPKPNTSNEPGPG